ncbi:MAG: hypothetical protein EBX35_12745, partial [Planctomycetia bacterium]|nr:hypothetical protein [Planctomycetia bacterium]
MNVTGDGAVELVPTRPYEFGDSVAHMDIPGSLTNALLREAAEGGRPPGGRLRLDQRDIEVHKTRNTPKCATTVVLDMSGSMRYGGLYVDVKKMALALQGLEKGKKGYELTPKALRTFQGKLLEQIFAALDPSRTGRHQVNVTGDGAVELVP